MHSRLRVRAFIDGAAPEAWEVDLAAALADVADVETWRMHSSDSDLPFSFRAVDRVVAGTNRQAADMAPRAVASSHPIDLWVDATAAGSAGTRDPAQRVWRVAFGEPGRTHNQAITAAMCRSLHEPLTVLVHSSSRRSGTPTTIAVAHLTCDPVSVSRNRARAWWAARDLLVRSIRDLQASGREPAAREPQSRNIVEEIHPLRAIGRGLARRARLRLQPEQWTIEIAQNSAALHSPPGASNSFHPPRDELWADPFLVERAGRSWVFFEVCALRGGRGAIAVGRVTERGLAEVRIVLRRPYHLSYPYVLAHGGELWMVPESAECGRVELYRCREFPDVWTREAVLLTGVTALDPTIAHHNGRFWLWVAIASGGDGAAAQLHLFHSEDLIGPWHAHERNPVITDCRSLRPAGPPFVLDDVLVRPAQCAIPRYGTAVVFNAVDELSPTRYAERPVGRLESSAWPTATGVHHFCRADRLQAFDVRRRRQCACSGFVERWGPVS
jgi:hypothetical protein